MEKNTVLQQADDAYNIRHYADALSYYMDADKSRATLTDSQLYRYAKLLYERENYNASLTQLEKVSEAGLDDFETAVLLYRLKKAAAAPDAELIELLKQISKISYDEELMFDLAELYAKSGSAAYSKRVCKQMINFFHSGEWVEKAKRLLADENTPEVPPKGDLSPAGRAVSPPCPLCVPLAPEPVSVQEELPDFLKEAFDGIVGMDSVKNELKKFYNLARIEKLRTEKLGVSAKADKAYNFILYGNPGTGKTMVARIIGKALFTLGIRENDSFIEVDRGKIVAQHIGETAKLTQRAINSARGGTLFVDEAYTLYQKDNERDFGSEAIDTLLKDMEDNRSEYSVIIAGYHDRMTEMLNNSNPGFRSRFTFHINIPDYSDDELIQIAKGITDKRQYVIEPVVGEEAIKKRIARERIDETFGNARFIRELMNEAEMNMASRLAKMSAFSEEDLVLIRAQDICPPDDNQVGLNELVTRLNSLTGLSDVKQHVKELMDKILVQKETERRGLSFGHSSPSMHMAFKGNAGTGKTTVARLIGQIFGELGVLKRGNIFVECTREDLVGQYQGQTAVKTKDVIRSAMGGVLFIDEAYSLKNSDSDSFGQEAINTLVAAMENHRDSLIVILAGYTTDIDAFLQTNQGLRSRVTQDLIFEDYTSDEMLEIFYQIATGSNFRIAEELRPKIKIIFEEKCKQTDFGNGRGVRNVFESVIRKQKSRIASLITSGKELQDEDFFAILEEDFK